jgi:hypothetical protein
MRRKATAGLQRRSPPHGEDSMDNFGRTQDATGLGIGLGIVRQLL